NIWEACWHGDRSLVGIASSSPHEGSWYGAHLCEISLDTGARRTIYAPSDQLGCIGSSASGKRLAFVEGLCSDRLVVSGNLFVFDIDSQTSREIDTHGIDVTCVEWRSESTLLVAGHRGFETVIATYNVDLDNLVEIWASGEVTAAGRYAS